MVMMIKVFLIALVQNLNKDFYAIDILLSLWT